MDRTKVRKCESIADYFSRIVRNHKKEVDMDDLYKHRKRFMGSDRE